MNSLERHVEKLFASYQETAEVKELKEEILSNLEAKSADFQAEGLEAAEADQKAVSTLERVDFFFADTVALYLNRWRLEVIQILLLYTLIAWVITIPLTVLGLAMRLHFVLLLASVVIGLIYFSLYLRRGGRLDERIVSFSRKALLRLRKLVWIGWSALILALLIGLTLSQFGSNIWFQRPVLISGPYQFATLAVSYGLPFVSLILPLVVSAALRLVDKYKVGDEVER
ncbi:hypothetical protein M3202_20575 [Alkalihalobacillus oceani]|uniref:Uncharacterized protein n=1 Tax=Halalkalibacter oceani TaxID=1653776 RepID=A0A9X2DT29_9BACI|nr:hypothetical protein [Halalkalibacter oceani]MCM3716444.1 hypothetical protein [Halalkalibacter oceani]